MSLPDSGGGSTGVDVEPQSVQTFQEPENNDRGDTHVTEAMGAGKPAVKKRARKEPVALVREPGKSLLPFSRVQKIIKADKDIPIIAKDATFLISLATEQFITRLCEAGKRVAEREKRATVQHKDIGDVSLLEHLARHVTEAARVSATVVRKMDEFLFLEEIIPWLGTEPPARRNPQGKGTAGLSGAPTLLDQLVISRKGKEGDERTDERGHIVMNED